MTPHRLRSAVAAFGVLWLGLPPAAGAADEAPKAPASQTNAGAVMPGRTIAIEYTMSLEDGTRLGSNVGEAPYEFEVGAQNVLPGLDAAVVGMLPGERRRIEVPPEQAYGPVYTDNFHVVPVADLPEEGRTVGAQIVAEDAEGNEASARVVAIRDDRLILDFNHPLAGKTVIFDVRILEVR